VLTEGLGKLSVAYLAQRLKMLETEVGGKLLEHERRIKELEIRCDKHWERLDAAAQAFTKLRSDYKDEVNKLLGKASDDVRP
jgi:hypothetical protein